MSARAIPNLVERAMERLAALAATRSAPPPPMPAIRNPVRGGVQILSIASLTAAGMAVAGVRRSRIGEEWRVTAGHLLRTLRAIPPEPDGTSNLIMVTSPRPKEGKTFSALNLAGSLALGGLAEVLLVDLDGALSERLGIADRAGLFDLAGDASASADDAAVRTTIPGLCVLPIGHGGVEGLGAAERTVTRPVVAAIEALARAAPNRVVILDCGPCLANSDPSALAPSVGLIAMVVEAERTQRDDLEAALELLRPCPNITLILNKVRLVSTQAFGDDDHRGS